ncbi:MAG: glyceraldehyde-3-phosphate dehydrogenase [Denitrovibrio sp.]|nr:MAG: glyceraldehyde-3-phosphate dehydrogenase [Denitrovibrio sp.]
MLRIGINGFGRIGRAIYRVNQDKKYFEVVAINDINPDIDNIAYTLNYDTLYGRIKEIFSSDKATNTIYNTQNSIKVFHEKHVDEVDWKSVGVDVVIDASGVLDNVMRARKNMQKNNLKKVVITHSPEKGIDQHIVMGANEESLDLSKHDIISSSICDAVAIAPVLKHIDSFFGVENGYITTLHPWLNYQNLMDGSASSWSVPGEIFHHYALGRSVIGNMIPKPTSAINATCKVLDNITEEMIGSFSYRTPTAIVGSADITLNLKRKTNKDEIIKMLSEVEKKQTLNIIHNNIEPLVSLDFKGFDYSTVVDHRWTEVVQGGVLKLVLWYDNEWGYSARAVDLIKLIESKIS